MSEDKTDALLNALMQFREVVQVGGGNDLLIRFDSAEEAIAVLDAMFGPGHVVSTALSKDPRQMEMYQFGPNVGRGDDPITGSDDQ